MAGRKVLIASAAGLWLYWQVDISIIARRLRFSRRTHSNCLRVVA